MALYLGRRSLIALLSFLCLSVEAVGTAEAWSRTVHQRVTSEAIETLPKALRAFYKQHRLEMPTLSGEATAPVESEDHRFLVDRFSRYPFRDLPRTESALREQFGDKVIGAGRLPWMIQAEQEALRKAFGAKDKNGILEHSDRLGLLIADLHNPLALTENFDGDKTGQHGLWTRFSIRLPEALEGGLKLKLDAAHYLDDPFDHIFSILQGSYVWLDNILYFDDLAHRGQRAYTDAYYELMAERTESLIQQRMSLAAGDTGSFWYTAWTAAGRPALP